MRVSVNSLPPEPVSSQPHLRLARGGGPQDGAPNNPTISNVNKASFLRRHDYFCIKAD